MIVISLGGSRIVPNFIDCDFLRDFKKCLQDISEEIIIVSGGGKTARKYQSALKDLGISDHFKLDEIGILATKLNAKLVSDFLGVEVQSGTVPGHSTDYVAMEIAEARGASKVINFSNIAYVYDKDPNKFSDAIKIEELNYSDYLKMFDSSWTPGMNVPFDVKAAKKGFECKIPVYFTDSLEGFKAILDGKKAGSVLFSTS